MLEPTASMDADAAIRQSSKIDSVETSGEPWMRVNGDVADVNFAQALDDPESILHFYRALIRLRHEEPVVAHGDFTMELRDHDRLIAFRRRYRGSELTVVGNMSDAVATIPDESLIVGELILRNTDAPGDGRTLEPWEVRVYRLAAT